MQSLTRVSDADSPSWKGHGRLAGPNPTRAQLVCVPLQRPLGLLLAHAITNIITPNRCRLPFL
jgi:hypothetical protein